MSTAAHYPSRFYDAIHVGNPGDVDFYLGVCRGTDTVLELGCGAGRITRALADAGHDVTGLDIDTEALEIAAQHGCRVLRADMREFDLGARFDRVLIPYNSLYCLLDSTDVLDCLRCARRHLEPGGRLALDCYAMDAWHAQPGAAHDAVALEADDAAVTIVVDERVYDVYEQSEWEPRSQRADTVYRHVPRDGGPAVVAGIPQRYLLSAQLAELIRESDLELVSLHGNFQGEPFEQESEMMVVVAARAG